MNSDASDARKERGGRGERRFLRLGREGSVQLPGEESWLEELEVEGYEYEGEGDGGELDEGVVRRLVGGLLEWDVNNDEDGDGDGDGDAGEREGVVRAADALGGAPGVRCDIDTLAGASEGSLSWDESDAFWGCCTPSPTISVTVPAVPAPRTTPLPALSSGPKQKKRRFEVKRDGDEPQTPGWEQESPVLGAGKKVHAQNQGQGRSEKRKSRSRSVLGDGSANVNVNGNGNVNGGGVGMLTPGSYYDEEGFLRV